MALTSAQQRILNAVEMAGEKRFNARARRPVEALEAAGLVTTEWVVRPDALHGRHTLHVIVKPTKGTK